MALYEFQCPHCYEVSGIVSLDPGRAPTCCHGDKMEAIALAGRAVGLMGKIANLTFEHGWLLQRVAELEDAAEERFEELLTWNIEASVALKKCRARLAEYEGAMEGVTVEDLRRAIMVLYEQPCPYLGGENVIAALRRLAGVVDKKEES